MKFLTESYSLAVSFCNSLDNPELEAKNFGHGLPISKHCTVKPVLSGHLKIDKTKVLMENGSLMKVKRIAECSPWSILQYF